VFEKDASTFALEREVSPEQTKKVIIKSVERLLERDSPSLETVKMQIEYDTSFQKFDNDAQKIARVRNKMISSHKISIVEVEMDEANDFEALTTLYRKIFRFLLDFAPTEKQVTENVRSIEREVAAALESVFPRIGLKAFVQLNVDEKQAQLFELARIILGIRLFNKDQGRGGAGLQDIERESVKVATHCISTFDQEVESFTDACAKYQKAIVRALLERRKFDIDANSEVARLNRLEDAYKADDKNDQDDDREAKGEAKAAAKSEYDPSQPLVRAELISTFIIDRWQEELTNRRQYLGFLRLLQDEMQGLQEKTMSLNELLQQELINLRSLVGTKTSVSKEVVYPRFDSLGSTWIELFQLNTILKARQGTYQALSKYRLSFTPTLAEKFYTETAKVAAANKDDLFGGTIDIGAAAHATTEAQAKDDGERKLFQQLMQPNKNQPIDLSAFESGDTPATLLTPENTADFMSLPLEIQGFCPWTMVHARGLLVPGKPNLGVVRFDNMYFVCDHEAGLRAFIMDPATYLNTIREKVMASPEYIHLLRMQKWFPGTSIHKLLEQQAVESSGGETKQGFGGKPATKDASTDTPIHFVERHIDNNYHWNEWELRRRALQVVNLRNCVTTSQQTDSSHFRRDNESQVYEARTHDTQTRRDKGTNPPIVTTYMAGLRGRAGHQETSAITRYTKDAKEAAREAKEAKDHKDNKHHPPGKASSEKGGARIISLTLDL
jgi:hypothetical protein